MPCRPFLAASSRRWTSGSLRKSFERSRESVVSASLFPLRRLVAIAAPLEKARIVPHRASIASGGQAPRHALGVTLNSAGGVERERYVRFGREAGYDGATLLTPSLTLAPVGERRAPAAGLRPRPDGGAEAGRRECRSEPRKWMEHGYHV